MRTTLARNLVAGNRRRIAAGAITAAVITLLAFSLHADEWISGIPWPEPAVVDPGPTGGPPSDAIVLFDGKDCRSGKTPTSGPSRMATPLPAAAISIRSRPSATASCTWNGPRRRRSRAKARARQQRRLPDGPLRDPSPRFLRQPDLLRRPGGGVYKERPPLVNVCRKPGQWQTYDIVFEAPRFDQEGKLLRPASSRCFRTACWCRTTSAFRARQRGTCADLHGPSGEVAAGAAIPRQSGAFPQHLDSRVPPADAPPPTKQPAKA